MLTRDRIWMASAAAIAAAGMATGAGAAGMSDDERHMGSESQTDAAPQRGDDAELTGPSGGELGATSPGEGTVSADDRMGTEAETDAAAQRGDDAEFTGPSGGELGATSPGEGTVSGEDRMGAETQTGAATQRGYDGAEAELGRVQHANGIRYACTGVGDEAQNDPRWNDWPAKLVFAANSGDYLTDVDVTIRDKASGDVVFQAGCEYGPWMVVDLEPGKYEVTTQALDRTAETFSLNVGGKQQAQQTVVFDEVDQT